MSANDRQVAGDHYSVEGEQHWDRQWKLHGRGYFVGCITKYVERYHKKNGLQDLEKAKHFLEKLIELEKDSVEASKYKVPMKFDHETRGPVILSPGTLELDPRGAGEPGRGYVTQD